MFDFQSVTKIYIKIMTVVAIIFSILGFATFGLRDGFMMFICSMVAVVSVVVLYHANMVENLKAILVSLMPIIVCNIFGILTKELGTQFTTVTLCVIVSTLYFNKWVCIADMIYLNILYFGVFVLKPDIILAKVEIMTFFIALISLNAAIIALTYIIRRGQSYLVISENKSKELEGMIDRKSVV